MSSQPRANTSTSKTSRQSLTPASENTNVTTTNANAKRPTCANTTLTLEELCKLSFEQLCKLDTKNKATSVPQAREILDKGGYLARDAPVTTLIVATILMSFLAFHDGRLLGKEAQSVLRAIAMILADEDTSTTANLIASRVADMTEEMLEEMRKVTKGLDAATSTMLQTAEEADSATERMARQAEELFGDQGRMMDIAENVEATLSTLQEHTGRLEDRLRNLLSAQTVPPLPHLSHEAWPPLPSQPMPTPPPEVVVRHNAAERNVVFDLNMAAAADARNMSKDELVRRANVAVDKMGVTPVERPREMIFAAATKLTHGGIWYRVQDAACAAWIKNPQVKEHFLKEFFGGAGSFKARHYTVIVEFVSTAFNVENPEELREIERVNGLGKESVISCRWLKNPKNSKEDQQRAHLKVACGNPETATQLIRDGTIMEGRILITRKKLIEPERCMKCQEYGHKAYKCKSKNDICALCAETHRMSECSANTKKCANCASDSSISKHDHHASDRICPIYIRQVELMRQKHPDNRYRFFPVISDPNTWDAGEYQPSVDPNRWYGPRSGHPMPRPQAPSRRPTPTWATPRPSGSAQGTPRARRRTLSVTSIRSDMSLGTQRSLCQTTLTGSGWASRVPTPTPPNDDDE
jgi:hypothetical protein